MVKGSLEQNIYYVITNLTWVNPIMPKFIQQHSYSVQQQFKIIIKKTKQKNNNNNKLSPVQITPQQNPKNISIP